MDIFNKLDIATRKHITSYLFDKVYDEKGFFWLELNDGGRIYINNRTHEFMGYFCPDDFTILKRDNRNIVM